MEPLLATAGELRRRGDAASAVQICRQILTGNEQHAGALNLLGLLHLQLGRHREALASLTRAAELEPTAHQFHVDLATAYCELQQFDQAERCCRRALQLSPDDAPACATLGGALAGLNRREEAHAQLRRALELDPNLALAHEYLGTLWGRANRLGDALAHLQRAAELDPSRVTVRMYLGRLLLNMNQPEAALPHLTAAVETRPQVAELHRNLGNALHGLGRLPEARRAYQKALELDPGLAWAQANLAMVLEHEGNLDDALEEIRQAVESMPENPMFWAQMANLRERRGEYGAAHDAWQRTQALQANSARTHLAVGKALQRTGRADAAAEQFHAALRLQKDLVEAHDCLTSLYEELGETEQAEQAARTSLAIKPRHAQARAALARLLGRDLPAEDFDALDQLLKDPQVPAASQVRLRFARARVLDARGDRAQAAASARQAHELALELARRAGRAYDAEVDSKLADALIGAFDASFFERVRGAGHPTRRPVFIVGLPRSGSTLVAQILASHPEAYAAGELSVALETFRSVPEVVGANCGTLEGVARLDDAAISGLAERHLERLRAIDQGRCKRIVDKELANYQFLGLLAAYFPHATFIHCRRGLRDVAVSCWFTDFDHAPWSHSPAHIGAYFRRYLRLMEHWRAVLPAAIHEVVYEDIVADFAGQAKQLLAACGLDWDDACLNFHRHRRQVRTSSASQVRQPIYSHAVSRWKHYESELADLFAALPRR
ncbi:MAG: sulfotransferase family protein [Planctomycetota bacterium]|nr:MAG: sulfotransferase family protein [Planctomycetota bacterium]